MTRMKRVIASCLIAVGAVAWMGALDAGTATVDACCHGPRYIGS